MRYLKRCLVNSIVISVLWVVLPTAAFAAVEITEVAWMGTVESQYGEWIELHNSGSELVSVDGWKLYQDGGGTLVFSLSKTIPAGGYLVIERATPSVPDPLPGVADESGTFGGSGLANTGEHLVLKDGSGLVVNSLSFGSGWPAGDATSKQTMQKSGNAWITADPTPKAATKDAVISEGEIDNTTSDPVDSSNGNTEPKIVWRPSIAFDAPRQAFTGVPISIVATVTEESGMTTVGYFFWNLGDGTVIEQRNLAPVTAVYQYLGEYVVTLAYARFANASEPELVESFSVTVSEPVLRVEQGTAGTIFVKNNGVSMVDLHQWRLSYNGTVYTFPRYSMLKPKAKLAVPVAVFGVTSFTALPTLSNPSGSMVADGVAVQDPLGSSMISAQIRPVRNIVPAASPQVLGTNTVETAFATADETDTVPALKNNQRTWVFIALGALVAISVFLFLLLERFKARAE